MTTAASETRAADTIACDRHGRDVCAIVCQHHVRVRDRAAGFIENSSDPDDLQAWCRACEDRFIAEGAPTRAFLLFNLFAVVCATCYREMKWRHAERSRSRDRATFVVRDAQRTRP